MRSSPGEKQMDFGGILASPRKSKALQPNPGREEPDAGQRDSGDRGK